MPRKEANSKVYIPQVPSKFDHGSGLWIPTVNMTAAHRYGEFVEMLPPGANRLATAPLTQALKEKMAGYKKEDYLVAIGDPSIIAISSAIAVDRTSGLLRLLKWDRQTNDYILVEVKIW
jgi:hypothetical protein